LANSVLTRWTRVAPIHRGVRFEKSKFAIWSLARTCRLALARCKDRWAQSPCWRAVETFPEDRANPPGAERPISTPGHPSPSRRPRSRRGTDWFRAFDPLTLAGAVHRLPQIAAPLHVEPEVGAVPEHAREDERRRLGHVPAVVAQLVDMLALNAHRLGQRGLRQPHGLHELLDQDFADRGRLAFRRQHGSPHL